MVRLDNLSYSNIMNYRNMIEIIRGLADRLKGVLYKYIMYIRLMDKGGDK
ncbi:hypothetical protein [Tissierella praeacuta]